MLHLPCIAKESDKLSLFLFIKALAIKCAEVFSSISSLSRLAQKSDDILLDNSKFFIF